MARTPPYPSTCMILTHHAPNEVLPRHQHVDAFAALVLSGHYAEAGDAGRYRVEAGDLLIHQAFESHIDRFDSEGAEVLVIGLPGVWSGPLLGQIADPDKVVRTAEHDVTAEAPARFDGLRGPICLLPMER